MEPVLWAVAVNYRVRNGHQLKRGIGIGLSPGVSDFVTIIGEDGFRLKEVFDYKVIQHEGAIIFNTTKGL